MTFVLYIMLFQRNLLLQNLSQKSLKSAVQFQFYHRSFRQHFLSSWYSIAQISSPIKPVQVWQTESRRDRTRGRCLSTCTAAAYRVSTLMFVTERGFKVANQHKVISRLILTDLQCAKLILFKGFIAVMILNSCSVSINGICLLQPIVFERHCGKFRDCQRSKELQVILWKTKLRVHIVLCFLMWHKNSKYYSRTPQVQKICSPLILPLIRGLPLFCRLVC